MKQIALFFLFGLFCLFNSSEGQAQDLIADTVFHLGYHDAVNGMIVTDNGECILVGKMDTDSLTPKNIWIYRLGFQGDTLVTVLWDKIIYPQNSSRVGCVKWIQDGNFIIAGSWNNSNMIMTMSPEGDSISTITVPGNGDTYFKDVVELPDGDFVVLQVDVTEDLYAKLLRLTSDGTVVWEQAYNDRYYSSLEYNNSDSLMLAGYEYHQEYQHLLFGSVTPDGDELFTEMYQEYYGFNYCMAVDSASFYLGNSKAYLTSEGMVSQVIKMTPEGEVEWEADFTGIGSEVVKDIEVYDEYLITCSEYVTPYYSNVIIGAITFSGVLFSTKLIPKPIPTAVAIGTFENNLYVTGRQFNGANGKDIFFQRYNLDSLFVVISNAQEYAVNDQVKIFPNPASSQINVVLDNQSDSDIAAIRVFNTVGRLEQEMKVSSGAKSYQVEVGNLPQGLYLVVIQFENRSPVTKKILVAH